MVVLPASWESGRGHGEEAGLRAADGLGGGVGEKGMKDGDDVMMTRCTSRLRCELTGSSRRREELFATLFYRREH